MVPFLTQVQYYRLMLEKGNRLEFARQARTWLNTYGNITFGAATGRGQAITVFNFALLAALRGFDLARGRRS